jgi:RNA polymerase nonessential primary-like sigma factor
MSTSLYYDLINRTPLLTKEEEKALLVTFKSESSTALQKKRARDRLIEANLRFVFKTAKKYARRYPASFEDLLSSGNEGLMVGVDKYSIESGNRLLTYAGWWILQRILKEMSKLRLVALPIWKQQLAAKIARLKEGDEDITFEQILAACPGHPEKDVRELSETAFLTCFIEDLSDTELVDIEFQVEDEIDDQRLHQRISELSDIHRQVLMMSLGFDDGLEKSIKEISKTTGLTRDEVNAHKREALETLRSGYGVEL